MTTISDNPGYIDYAAFSVNADDLTSLRALVDIWRLAMDRAVVRYAPTRLLGEFVELSKALPLRIDDIHWQQQWMHAWHKLSRGGFSSSDLFGFFNHAMAEAEMELFDGLPQVGRMQLRLFGILRRCVVAAVSCAIEVGEEAHGTDAGLPGEWAAMRALREFGESGRQVAVLSVSMINRHARSHLTASDLQSLPALLSEQLGRLLRPQDLAFVGHEGEWLLLLTDVHSMAQPALAATQIGRAFDHPVRLLGGRAVALDTAIGIALSPDHGDDPEEIVQAARLARASLIASGDPFALFDWMMKVDWQVRHQLSEELREALRTDRLQLYLQPQMEVGAETRCIGAELLLRWRRGNGEWVPPPLVIELIEEYGWRSQLTDWLIRAALRCSAELEAGGVEMPLSLNLTAGDLLDNDLPELVGQCLETWQLPAERFTFELTESAMMYDRQRSLDIMMRLRNMGIRFALDDFGTGYSSLSYLATLPVDEVKIDRSFIDGMLSSADKLRIVKTIVDLARDLGMQSIAEGVEEVGQCDELQALGCNRVQGYLYAVPMPMTAFIDWYRAFQA
ncbi:putative bifunctional diguanylate cyclase/phosphodiesterase [Dechloromonas sp. ARDL1]|uniref:putative bifunctional diguanylate cyclase/phosphodiesterase n=1 Tax=Dechloromonas sp. ARDL1 TaxID=3322121 RepID=UPI003DA73F4A